MKKFYKITLSCLVAGLVLMGTGVAVTLCEMSSIRYMGSKYNEDKLMVTDNIEIKLPDNLAKIFREGYGDYFDIIVDEGLSGNDAVLSVTHSADLEVEVTPSIEENYYLYNNYTDNFSKYPVNSLVTGYSVRSLNEENDFNRLKEILSDFKNKEIYDYSTSLDNIEFKLRVSAEGYERFEKLPDGYSLFSYGEYMSEMSNKEDIN